MHYMDQSALKGATYSVPVREEHICDTVSLRGNTRQFLVYLSLDLYPL